MVSICRGKHQMLEPGRQSRPDKSDCRDSPEHRTECNESIAVRPRSSTAETAADHPGHLIKRPDNRDFFACQGDPSCFRPREAAGTYAARPAQEIIQSHSDRGP